MMGVCSSLAVRAASPDENSCQAFVQEFYKWYIGKSNNNSKSGDPLSITLKTRPELFGAELTKRLKEDSAAAAKSPDEIVGLDFDPILNTQEQVQNYKAEKVSTKGPSFFVDMHALLNGKREAQAAVVPELVKVGSKWQFVNFHYKVDKKDDDLLHILKQLRDERQANKKK